MKRAKISIIAIMAIMTVVLSSLATGCSMLNTSTIPDLPSKPVVPSESTVPESEIVLQEITNAPKPIAPEVIADTISSIPITEKMYFTPTKEDEIVIAPAFFELAGLIPTSRVDTWTSDGYLSVGTNRVTYKKGDPIGFVLYNNGNSTKQFKIEIVNAPDNKNWSEATGESFEKAPSNLNEIITVDTSVITLESGEAARVEFAIRLESSADYPDQWEFRIMANPVGTGYQVGGGIRMFIYMR